MWFLKRIPFQQITSFLTKEQHFLTPLSFLECVFVLHVKNIKIQIYRISYNSDNFIISMNFIHLAINLKLPFFRESVLTCAISQFWFFLMNNFQFLWTRKAFYCSFYKVIKRRIVWKLYELWNLKQSSLRLIFLETLLLFYWINFEENLF